MFESLAVFAVALAAAALVYVKARDRLATPGARRSRRDGDAGPVGRDRRERDTDGDDGSDD